VVGFSRDGKRIAFGARHGGVWIQPASATGAALVMRDPPVFGAPAREIQFSPDGQLLAVRYDGILQLWASSGQKLPQLTQVDSGLRRIAFSADGRFIAAASENRVWLWPRTEVTPDSGGVGQPTELKGHSARVESIAFTTDGDFVVTASSDHTARVWRTAAAEPQVIYRVPSVYQAALASTGAFAAIVSNEGRRSRLTLWRLNADDATEVASMPAPDGATTVRVSPIGTHVLTISSSGQLRVWHSTAGTRQLDMILDQPHVAAAAFNPDGASIKVIDADGIRIRQWRIGSAWVESASGPSNKEGLVAWSRDGSRSIGLSPGASMAVSTDASSWIELGAVAPKTQIVFDARGSRVVADTNAGTYVWTLNEMQAGSRPVGILLPKAGDTPAFAAFNPDGSRVLIVDVKGTARVFSADGTGSPIELVGAFRAVTFDEDGSHVIGVTNDGEMLRSRVGWQAMIDALANATTACLTSGQRIQYFAESADTAQASSRACQERKRKP
jgi:WD40 repeat protein